VLQRLDRWLGFTDAHTLNWRGRSIERVIRLFHVVDPTLDWKSILLPIMRLLHLARPDPTLTWKRALAPIVAPVYARVTSRDFWGHKLDLVGGLIFRGLNEVVFQAYRLAGWLRPSDRVRSVLQLSIVSHKPFMLSRLMRQEGLKSDFMALNTNVGSGILNMGWDYHLPAGIPRRKRRVLEFFYFWLVMARYDVIHSHFKTFMSEDAWELKYLRRLNKVLVFHFRGCDIRYRSRNMQLQPGLNCCQECEYPVGSCDTPYQQSQIDIARQAGDLFFVTTPDLLEFMEGSEHHRFIPPLEVNLEEIVAAPRPPGVFRVVTSSTHDGIDGTRFIRAAVEQLRNEGRSIELVQVKDLPYREALAIYKSADVFVGKLRMGYYNNANIETMQLGVPNMSYIRPEFQRIAPDCPIIVTTPDTVYERLRYYIDRPDELRAIGAKGPAFVNSEHNPHVLGRRMIERYNDVWRAKRKVQPCDACAV
jgi:hypothetical protein